MIHSMIGPTTPVFNGRAERKYEYLSFVRTNRTCSPAHSSEFTHQALLLPQSLATSVLYGLTACLSVAVSTQCQITCGYLVMKFCYVVRMNVVSSAMNQLMSSIDHSQCHRIDPECIIDWRLKQYFHIGGHPDDCNKDGSMIAVSPHGI